MELSRGWTAERYTTREGLPVNSVNDLTWSRDGYLWLATWDGLVRFDGNRFTVYTSVTSPGLAGNRLIWIAADEAGNLWLVTEDFRLVKRTPDGRFEEITREKGLPGLRVNRLRTDAAGGLWVCGDRGVARIQRGAVVPVEAASGQDVKTLLADRLGRLWVAVHGGEVQLWEGRERVFTARLPEVSVVGELSDGSVYAGTVEGLWRLAPGPLARVVAGVSVFPIEGDWAAANDGAAVRTEEGFSWWDGKRLQPLATDEHAGKIGPLVARDGEGVRWRYSAFGLWRDGEPILRLGSGSLMAVVPGPEGSLFVATQGGGLIRLGRSAVQTIAEGEGVYPVVAEPDGTLLVGVTGRWARVDPASSKILERHQGPGVVRTLARDRAGTLWIGGLEGLCRVEGDSCVPAAGLPSNKSVFALHFDRSGVLWVGAQDGLFRRDTSGRWQLVDRGDGRHGVPSRYVRVIAEERGGALWMGTAGDGLLRWDGRHFRLFTTGDGLASNMIRSILVDGDGAAWVGTEDRGLVHVRLTPRGIAAVSIRASHGLHDDNINQILRDGMGRLFMSTNRGIFWVLERELQAFVRGQRDRHDGGPFGAPPAPRVRSVSFNERHGLASREANGGVQSAGAVDSKGRLWFPTVSGLAGFTPSEIPMRRDPPPARIEELVELFAGGVSRPAGTGLRLPPDRGDFRIDYTALSFTTPDLARFRYRLDGYDASWIDAGARRSAFYTRVPAGRYRFEVSATYEGSDREELGAPLEIEIEPTLTEKSWFRAVAAGLLVSLIPLAAWARNRALSLKKQELEHVVERRTREADALAELDHVKTKFFTDVSHELRTPLTMIIGPLTDLLEAGDVSRGQQEALTTMRRNALRLLRLVNQILDLHRMEAGGLALVRSVGDLRALAREVADSFAPLAERRGLRISVELPEEAVPVSFDRDQLEKVAGNLLSNAVKFTPPGGTITVRVTGGDPEGHAVLSVEDSGPGIAEDELPRIFDRYYRGAGPSTLQEGSGIGLSLARELTRLHGGTLSVTSSRGRGSVFHVSLPRASGETAASARPEEIEAIPPAPREALPLPDADRPTVLVVEDNPDVGRYVESILSDGFRVLTARDGGEGLRAAREALPDLVLSDVMMPVMDGFQLLSALREDPMTRPIPVVLLTARATPRDEVDGLALGADDYLAKPFSSAVLKARIHSILDRRQALKERLLKELRASDRPAPAEAVGQESAFAARLRAAFRERLCEGDVSLEALGSALGMSRSTLARRIEETFGETPAALLRAWRLETAAELLGRKQGSITEVAVATGFASLAHFSRTFRTRYGVAPSEYQHREL